MEKLLQYDCIIVDVLDSVRPRHLFQIQSILNGRFKWWTLWKAGVGEFNFFCLTSALCKEGK